MSSVKWKDTSSFSQGEKDRTPSCWTAKAGRVRIVVHRHIHHAPDVWLLSCDALWIEQKELLNRDIEDSKGEAIGIVRNLLQQAIIELGNSDSDPPRPRCPVCGSFEYRRDGDWDNETGEQTAAYMTCRDCGHSGPIE